MSKVKKDQRNADKPKQKYRVTNWKAYNRALENRGNITFYFSEDLLAQWYSDLPNQRGAQQVYSDECIEAIMSFKTLFKLPYRQVRGFTEGLLSLLGEGGVAGTELFADQPPLFGHGYRTGGHPDQRSGGHRDRLHGGEGVRGGGVEVP